MMIYPYKTASESAKSLKEALNIKMIKTEGSKYKGSPEKVVVNWGATQVSEEVRKSMLLNNEEAVGIAANKLKFFEKVGDKVNIPEFTTNKEEARAWLEQGKKVVARTKLSGHSGDGIFMIRTVEDWEHYQHDAFKLYVKYVPKKDEYRVHIVGNKIVDVRKKGIKKNAPKGLVDYEVRNHHNGFIYLKDGFNAPEEVLSQSIKAVLSCGLDFGAVDVMWNNFYEKAYVLEINTAPGLEGSSIDNYAKGFQAIYDEGMKDYQERRRILFKEAKYKIADWQIHPIGEKPVGPAPKMPKPKELVQVMDDMVEQVDPFEEAF